MSWLTHLLEVWAWFAAVLFVIRGLCVGNHMTRRTPLPYKFAHIAMTVACMALVLGPLFPDDSVSASAYDMFIIGVAALMLLDRRARAHPQAARAHAEWNSEESA